MRKILLVHAVRIDDKNRSGAAEDELRAVRRPGRITVYSRIVRDRMLACPVRIDDINLSAAGESELRAVGRPGGRDRRRLSNARELYLVRAVRIHHPDLAVALI